MGGEMVRVLQKHLKAPGFLSDYNLVYFYHPPPVSLCCGTFSEKATLPRPLLPINDIVLVAGPPPAGPPVAETTSCSRACFCVLKVPQTAHWAR